MTSLADFQGWPVRVVLIDGHEFTAKLLSVRAGQVTFQSRTGWRSTHCMEDIKLWRPVLRRRQA